MISERTCTVVLRVRRNESESRGYITQKSSLSSAFKGNGVVWGGKGKWCTMIKNITITLILILITRRIDDVLSFKS